MDDLFLALFFISLLSLVVGLVKPSLVLRFLRGDKTRKKVALVFGGGVLLFFILFGVTASPTEQPEEEIKQPEETTLLPQEEITQPSQEEIEKQEPEKEIVEIGIGVSRKSIIDVFEKPAVGFSFSEGIPIRGQENYVGRKGTAIVQLLGPASDLSEASIMVLMSTDVEENILSLANMIGFANIINTNSVDWVTNEFPKIAADINKPYSNTKVFNKQLFKISLTPDDWLTFLNLTVTPAK